MLMFGWAAPWAARIHAAQGAEVEGLEVGFCCFGWELEGVSSEFWESEDGSQRMRGR